MSPFRALVLAVAVILVLGAVAAFLVGVPIWAVIIGTVVAALAAVWALGWLARKRFSRPKVEG